MLETRNLMETSLAEHPGTVFAFYFFAILPLSFYVLHDILGTTWAFLQSHFNWMCFYLLMYMFNAVGFLAYATIQARGRDYKETCAALVAFLASGYNIVKLIRLARILRTSQLIMEIPVLGMSRTLERLMPHRKRSHIGAVVPRFRHQFFLDVTQWMPWAERDLCMEHWKRHRFDPPKRVGKHRHRRAKQLSSAIFDDDYPGENGLRIAWLFSWGKGFHLVPRVKDKASDEGCMRIGLYLRFAVRQPERQLWSLIGVTHKLITKQNGRVSLVKAMRRLITNGAARTPNIGEIGEAVQDLFDGIYASNHAIADEENQHSSCEKKEGKKEKKKEKCRLCDHYEEDEKKKVKFDMPKAKPQKKIVTMARKMFWIATQESEAEMAQALGSFPQRWLRKNLQSAKQLIFETCMLLLLGAKVQEEISQYYMTSEGERELMDKALAERSWKDSKPWDDLFFDFADKRVSAEDQGMYILMHNRHDTGESRQSYRGMCLTNDFGLWEELFHPFKLHRMSYNRGAKDRRRLILTTYSGARNEYAEESISEDDGENCSQTSSDLSEVSGYMSNPDDLSDLNSSSESDSENDAPAGDSRDKGKPRKCRACGHTWKFADHTRRHGDSPECYIDERKLRRASDPDVLVMLRDDAFRRADARQFLVWKCTDAMWSFLDENKSVLKREDMFEWDDQNNRLVQFCAPLEMQASKKVRAQKTLFKNLFGLFSIFVNRLSIEGQNDLSATRHRYSTVTIGCALCELITTSQNAGYLIESLLGNKFAEGIKSACHDRYGRNADAAKAEIVMGLAALLQSVGIIVPDVKHSVAENISKDTLQTVRMATDRRERFFNGSRTNAWSEENGQREDFDFFDFVRELVIASPRKRRGEFESEKSLSPEAWFAGEQDEVCPNPSAAFVTLGCMASYFAELLFESLADWACRDGLVGGEQKPTVRVLRYAEYEYETRNDLLAENAVIVKSQTTQNPDRSHLDLTDFDLPIQVRPDAGHSTAREMHWSWLAFKQTHQARQGGASSYTLDYNIKEEPFVGAGLY